jgi:O-glycosyl hydrolase
MKKLIAVLMVLTLVLITTCQLAVDEAVQDVSLTDPYISKQPASASYFVGEDPVFPLSIDVYEWAENDGNLSYQWYDFHDIDDYVLGKARRIPGATGKTYTPVAPDFKTSAGETNYYYVEVTNNNSKVNIGPQSGFVRSEVAVISFTDLEDALPPVFSRHPGSASYQAGRAVNSLTTRVAVRPDRVTNARPVVLSYQWWTLTVGEAGGELKVIDRSPIPNATNATYQPDPLTLKAGENYFYVVVTSTEDPNGQAKKATQSSVPALIGILRGANAVAPSITIQPRDRMYFTGETAVALTVEGVSRDNGEISYQWYRNNGAIITATSGTPVDADEGKPDSYTPALPASGVTDYYYAVVTNYTDYVLEGGKETADATSKLVKVTVATAASAGQTSHSTVTVADPKVASNRYQYIRGYGGMDVAWGNFPETYPADMEKMYDPNELGYNINRIMISPGKVDPKEGIADLVNGIRPNYYENVRIVNKHGGYNLASPWSPPKEWKTNNSINGGGDLIPTYYQQFANYLKTFAQDMYNNGAPIYAISISNEPNYTAGYDGCEWNPVQMRNFYRQVGRFTTGVRGYGGGKQRPVVLTVNGESANNPDINLSALIDPAARSVIDLLCRHVYGNQDTTLWRFNPNGTEMARMLPWDSTTPSILDRGNGTKMEVWMTEHNINSANATAFPNDSTWPYVWRYMNDVDLVMRLNNENAFVWWASKRFYSMIGDNQYGTDDGAVLPRGWGLSHYAKYTIDTHRIKTDISGTFADGTAIVHNTTAYPEDDNSNVNNRDFKRLSLDNTTPRITAYASITSGKDNAPINDAADDVEYISLVMWTPTTTSSRNGINMGTIKIVMPAGFEIGSYTAIKTISAASTHVPETVTVAQDRQTAYVTLGASQMLSVKFIKQ